MNNNEKPMYKKIFIALLWAFVLSVISIILVSCTPTQEPVQTIINYTDNSQVVQVVGDNNQLDATSDIQAAEQTATPTQTTEETTEDGMWKFWLVVFAVLCGVVLYWYQKKRML